MAGDHGLAAALRRAEEDLRYPLGAAQPLHDLAKDFAHSHHHVRKIGELSRLGFRDVRRVRGDGNCFYRAVGFAWLEALAALAAAGRALQRALPGSWPDESLFGPLAEEYRDLRRAVSSVLRGSAREALEVGAWLFERLLGDVRFDLCVVVLVRRLVASFFDEEEAEGQGSRWSAGGPGTEPIREAVAAQYGTAHRFAEMEVLPLGQEAEGASIAIAARQLGVKMDIRQLDGSPGPPPAYVYPSEDYVSPAGLTVYLLFRPGHYELLYQANAPRLQEPASLYSRCSFCHEVAALPRDGLLTCFHRLCPTCASAACSTPGLPGRGSEPQCPICAEVPLEAHVRAALERDPPPQPVTAAAAPRQPPAPIWPAPAAPAQARLPEFSGTMAPSAAGALRAPGSYGQAALAAAAAAAVEGRPAVSTLWAPQPAPLAATQSSPAPLAGSPATAAGALVSRTDNNFRRMPGTETQYLLRPRGAGSGALGVPATSSPSYAVGGGAGSIGGLQVAGGAEDRRSPLLGSYLTPLGPDLRGFHSPIRDPAPPYQSAATSPSSPVQACNEQPLFLNAASPAPPPAPVLLPQGTPQPQAYPLRARAPLEAGLGGVNGSPAGSPAGRSPLSQPSAPGASWEPWGSPSNSNGGASPARAVQSEAALSPQRWRAPPPRAVSRCQCCSVSESLRRVRCCGVHFCLQCLADMIDACQRPSVPLHCRACKTVWDLQQLAASLPVAHAVA